MTQLKNEVTLTINAPETIQPVKNSRKVKFMANLNVGSRHWAIDISIPIVEGGELELWNNFKAAMKG